MQVYAALCHAFMPPLYAGTLCQGLYQVYATRAPLGFVPDRRGDRRTKSPQGPASPDPPVVGSVSSALALALASVAVSSGSGTSFLIKSVLPVCFMVAYAVALFCFMLVLCSTCGLPCPGRAWGQLKASVKPGFMQCLYRALCVSLCTSLCGVYAV